MSHFFETPILFIIFNRPDTTQRVFDIIRQVQPRQLFIAADGPRLYKEGEKEQCEKTRSIIKQINWDCEVKTLFREENLGCGKGPALAITWFFKNVEDGIILEDDCMPDLSFFSFSQELLEKYRDNNNIMMISGNNFQFGNKRGESDYYFSRYNYTWGWASWRRAWKLYDFEINSFPEFEKNKEINKIWKKRNVRKYWIEIFNTVYKGSNHIWDYQWTYTIWKNNGLTIVPNVNLVSNIGFSAEATHTKDNNTYSNLKVGKIISIKHPERIELDTKADDYYNKQITHLFKTKKILRFVFKLLNIDYAKVKSIYFIILKKLNNNN